MSPRFPVIGVFKASFAAGPVSIAPFAIANVLNGDIAWPALGWMPIVAILSIPFGFVVSLIPNFAGAALLTFLGNRYALARRRTTWAATGFVSGALIYAVTYAGWGPGNALFGLIGLVCALICRKGVDWSDPVPYSHRP